MTRSATAAVVAALLASGLAACGASERNDYVDGFNEIQRDFGRSVRSAAQIDIRSGPREIRDRVLGISRSVERSAGRMRDLDPPDDVRREHGRYVDALGDYATALREAARRISSRSPAGRIRAAGDVVEATDEVSVTTSRLTDRINDKL